MLTWRIRGTDDRVGKRLPGDDGPWGRWGTDQHGELTEVQERNDRQGLERRDFRLLAVTLFPYMREARRGTAASL